MLRARHWVGVCAAVVAIASAAPRDVSACGGCFHPENNPTESTVVTAHRMALALSKEQTVLWDQVQYSGNPADFAWVLPVKPGAVLELSTDAWFETLDATTTTRVTAPSCGGAGSFDGGDSGCGFGCGDSSAGSAEGGSGGGLAAPTVTVVHQGTVGPYATVTLHSTTPGALTGWLVSHGYAIDASVQPVIDAYEKEGFDFIALRLQPGKGVQSMKPVRVKTSGSVPTLPLRMVAAGTGANVAITLFVIGEGRWEPQNFPTVVQDPSLITWDFNTSSSNYATSRAADLAQNDGRTWLTTFAARGALLTQRRSNAFGAITYPVGNLTASTIGDAYVEQGLQNGETSTTSCRTKFAELADSPYEVVDPCSAGTGAGGAGAGGAGGGGGSGGAGSGGAGGAGSGGAGGAGSGGAGGAGSGGAGSSSSTGGGAGGAGGGPSCGPVASNQIDARDLACGALDDVAVALVGMHPVDVWITRLESDLPKAALADDLQMQASPTQVAVDNLFLATAKGNQCQSFGPPPPPTLFPGDGDRKARKTRREVAIYGAILAAVSALLLRRAQRPLLPKPRRRSA